MKRHRVLSTKILSETQRERLIQANISLIQANFIETKSLSFSIPTNCENWIFTSQNAVEAVFSLLKKEQCIGKKVFCVGEKTKSLLIENEQKVVKMSRNSLELGHFIAKNYKNEPFLFFCGNLKQEDLPHVLLEHQIPLTEVVVYQTDLIPKKMETPVDGVLFFSPSGVESFTRLNQLGKSKGICIGETTAQALKPYTSDISVATSPTIENVLLKTIQHFGTYEYVKK